MKVFVALSVLVALAIAEPPIYRQQNQQQRRYYFARQEEEPTTTPASNVAPYSPSGWKPAGPTFELPPQRQLEDSYGAPKPLESSPTSNVEQQYGAPEPKVQNQKQIGENNLNQRQQYQPQRFTSGFQYQQQQQQQFAASQNFDQQRRYLAPVSQPQINQYGVPEPQEQFQPPRPETQYGAPWTTTEEPSTTTTEIEESTTIAAPVATDSEVEPVNSVNELDEEGDLDEQQAEAQQQGSERGEYYVALPDGRLQRIRYVSHQDLEAMKYFARIRAENVEPLRGPIYSYSPLQEVQFASANLRLAPVSTSGIAAASSASSTSAKYELQEEARQSPPLAALLQYAYGAPSPVVPLSGASSYSNANYKAPNSESRYLITL